MWNKLYDTKLQSIGYHPCLTNLCVYYCLEDYKGIAFKCNRNRSILCLNQTAYINNLVHFAGLKDAFPANTPLSPSVQLTRFDGAKPKFNYGTYIAQFTTCFGPAHVTQVKRLVRYLKGTSTLGLTYCQLAKGFGKIGYSDANWGSNLIDRKSISGHVFMLGGAAVSWSAKKQATVALSTMEAEYMALSHACTQALWMQQFFKELYLYADAPTLILSDNLAALTLSVESQFHGRSKHIDIRHHFMRNIIEKRKVTTLYVPSNENLADAFTKALPAPQFRQSLAKLAPLIQLLPYVHRIGTSGFRQWIMDIIPSSTIQKLRRATKVQNEQAEEIIRARQELLSAGKDLSSETGRGKDIMTLLIKARESEGAESYIDRQSMIGHMNIFIFAGHEPMRYSLGGKQINMVIISDDSASITRILDLLAQHTSIQDRLREELRHYFESNRDEVHHDALLELPYLDGIVRESLRLFPPVSNIPRVCVEDTILSLDCPIDTPSGRVTSVPVKKGTMVFLNNVYFNRNKAIWGERANDFLPERWMEKKIDEVTEAPTHV
ncbi:cytochrome p450, partial [Rhizoctonia solani]